MKKPHNLEIEDALLFIVNTSIQNNCADSIIIFVCYVLLMEDLVFYLPFLSDLTSTELILILRCHGHFSLHLNFFNVILFYTTILISEKGIIYLISVNVYYYCTGVFRMLTLGLSGNNVANLNALSSLLVSCNFSIDMQYTEFLSFLVSATFLL